jgi:hypothetical protein
MMFSRQNRDRGIDRRAVLALGATLLQVLWVPLLTGLKFPSRMDELDFHVPNVRRFMDHFPSLQEMRDTDLSMLPLFHGFLGSVLRLTGDALPTMRFLMVLIGLSALFLYLRIARRIPGVDGWKAVPTVAALPYFGVCYFVVMTDYPALLALLGSVLGQLAYLRGGRYRAAYAAGLAGAAACLIRQNLIFAAGVFPLVLWLQDRPWFKPRSTDGGLPVSSHRPLLCPAIVPALLLPFLALAFQVWLWRGLIPPSFMARPSYFDARPATTLLSFFSIGASVGYYLLPATFTYALREGRSYPVMVWRAVAILTLFALFWCFHERGRDLVDIYGTFRHGLGFLRSRVGLIFSFGLLALSLTSFFILLAAGIRRTLQTRSPEMILLAGLLLASLFVTSYGLFRIYERHILPVFVFAVLFFLSAAPEVCKRSFTGGWIATIAFGAAHGVVYSISVYGLFR